MGHHFKGRRVTPDGETRLQQHSTKHKANLIRNIVCQTSAKAPTMTSGGCSNGSGLKVEKSGMA